MGYVAEYVKVLASQSQLAAHQLIWNMETNKFADEECHERDPELYDVLEGLIDTIVQVPRFVSSSIRSSSAVHDDDKQNTQ